MVFSRFGGILLGVFLVQTIVAQDKPLENLDQVDWLVGKWIGVEEPMESDIEGFGKAGDMASMHVEFKRILGGKFIQGEGVLHRGESEVQVFQELWGLDPTDRKIHQWFYDSMGSVYYGLLYHDGKRVINKISGKLVPLEGPAAELAKSLGLKEIQYSGDAIYEQRDGNTLVIVLRNIRAEGQPVPYPGADKEHVHHRVK